MGYKDAEQSDEIYFSDHSSQRKPLCQIKTAVKDAQ